MISDDELRSRLGAMADQTVISDVSLESVQARGRRRGMYQRGGAVLAAFALVIGGTVAVTSLTDDADDTDVATDEMPTTEAVGVEEADAAVNAAEPEAEAVSEAELSELSTVPDASRFAGGGQVVAWGDGFVRITNQFVGAVNDLPKASAFGSTEIASYFPQEIIDVIESAGDVSFVDDAVADALTASGFESAASEIVENNPEVSAWFEAQIDATFGEASFVTTAEYSDDGETWTPIDGFRWPVSSDFVPQVESNGEVITLLVHDSFLASEDPNVAVRVFSSRDLSNWTETVVPIETPAAPSFLTVEVSPGQLVVGADGWYLPVSTWSWLDLYESLPADVLAEVNEQGYGVNPTPAGIELQDWSGFESTAITTTTLGPSSEPTEPTIDESEFLDSEARVVRVVPWSAMPFTYADYLASSDGSLTADTAQAYVGDFDGNVFGVDGPGDSEDAGQVVATDAGFVSIASNVDSPGIGFAEGAADSEPSGPPIVGFFSTDAQTWTAVSLGELADVGAWVESVAAVDGGLLVTASDVSGKQRFFRGDADGSNMLEVPGPDIGDMWLWFDSQPGGIATVMDLGGSTVPESAPWSASFTHDGVLIEIDVTANGTQTLTISRDDEVVHQLASEIYEGPPYLWSDDGIQFTDAAGTVIVEVPNDVAQPEIFDKEAEAWEQAWEDNPYVADYRLVASRDGVTWSVVELPEPSEEFGWYGAAAINGDTVVVLDDTDNVITVPLP